MKDRILFLMFTFAAYLPVFAVQKPLFMLYQPQLPEKFPATDFLKVIWHGLSLDLTMAGYFTIIPLLIALLSVWLSSRYITLFLKGYFLFVALIIAAVFSVDLALYAYWGFRLDATPLFYLQSPKDAMASIPAGTFVLQTGIFIASTLVIYFLFQRYIIPVLKNTKVTYRWATSAVILLLGGLLVLPIRGGIGVATANVGQVYFSSNLFLNHAAINPCFSLMASVLKEQDFASQYNYLPNEERANTFNQLTEQHPNQAFPRVLTTRRPNIILILLESFSANAIQALGGEPDITLNLNKLSQEGILFTNMFASSFRTDRGIVSVLNAYPGQPTTSIMKYPAKSQTLPSIALSLDSVGYHSDMLYGGDINFTNMQSYFYASGYEKIVADRDFALKDRLSKWGANDNITFTYLLNQIEQRTDNRPFFTTFLTLSSHEPFEVPFQHVENPYLNSVAFTDSCLGAFINGLKQLPVWNNTLVILLSDHGFRYPDTIHSFSPEKQHIPMLWLGGAIKEPAIVPGYASQTDLAATLLAQLNIDHSQFTFSKNLFNPLSPRFAFYTFNNGFGFIDSTGVSVYDCESDKPLFENQATGNTERVLKGKALLQTLYDDLGGR